MVAIIISYFNWLKKWNTSLMNYPASPSLSWQHKENGIFLNVCTAFLLMCGALSESCLSPQNSLTPYVRNSHLPTEYNFTTIFRNTVHPPYYWWGWHWRVKYILFCIANSPAALHRKHVNIPIKTTMMGGETYTAIK